MSARRKLNAVYCQGSFLIACLLGGLTNSWVVFLVGLVVLIAGQIVAGDIRGPRDSGRAN